MGWKTNHGTLVTNRRAENRVSAIRTLVQRTAIDPSPISTTSVKLNLDTSDQTDFRDQEESGYHSRGNIHPNIRGGGLLGIVPKHHSTSSYLPPLPPLPLLRMGLQQRDQQQQQQQRSTSSNLPSTILSFDDYKYFGIRGRTPDWEIRSRMMTEEEKESRTVELLQELRAWKASQLDRTGTESEAGSAFSRQLHSSLSQPSFSFSGSSSFLHTPR